MKDTNGVIVYGWMTNYLGLKPTELLVYSVIYSFSQDGESVFYGSLTYLCKMFNLTKPTVIKILKLLVENGYIFKNSEVINNITNCKYRANLDLVDELLNGKNFSSEHENNLNGTGKKNIENSGKESIPNKPINNNKEDKQRDKEAKAINFTSSDFAKGLVDLGADEQEVADFMKVRKNKKASDTLTALNGFINECNKHNVEIKEAVKICVIRDWKGFKYDWLKEDEKPKKEPDLKLKF